MDSVSEKTYIAGPAGTLECLLDAPVLTAGHAARGVAFVAHPHPLFGGTMQNKVAQTLARAHAQAGWSVVRFNFRGVGESHGAYDHGNGELQDLLAAVAHFCPTGPIAFAGFSFGAFVASHAVAALSASRTICSVVLVGTAAGNFEVAPIPPTIHPQTLVLHGEVDDTIALSAVMDWARPQHLPVTVMPGVGHFFHGQLVLLRNLVQRHLISSSQ
jgi:alpha/beta superfamily hydrolase